MDAGMFEKVVGGTMEGSEVAIKFPLGNKETLGDVFQSEKDFCNEVQCYNADPFSLSFQPPFVQ